MLKFLLRAYPRRFVEHMGQEWLRDTRQELDEARATGRGAVLRWAWRTLGSVLGGAWVAHQHNWGVALDQGIMVRCGDSVVVVRRDDPKSAWVITNHLFISGLGAIIAGFVACKLWLALWVNGGGLAMAELAAGSSLAGIAGVLYVGGIVLFGVAGAWLAWWHRIRGRTRASGLPYLAWLIVMTVLSWSTTFMTWTLLDLGRVAQTATTPMVEYPETLHAMGLRDAQGNELVWRAESPDDANCTRARAVLGLVKAREIRLARESGDVFGLLLVDSMASSLWGRGCLDDQARIALNHDLVAAAQLDAAGERKLAWQGLGQLREGRHISAGALVLTQAKWCGAREVKRRQEAGQAIDAAESEAIRARCDAMANAKAAVLP